MASYGVATEIISSYKSLAEAIANLSASVNADYAAGMPQTLWAPPQEKLHFLGAGGHPWLLANDLSPPQMVSAALSQLSYPEKRADPRSTLIFPGVVLCSPDTIDQVINLNESKAAFKKAVLAAKNENSKFRDSDVTELLDRSCPGVRQILSSSGLGTMCLKHAYRPVHSFTAKDSAVFQFYFKVKTSSRRVSVTDEIRDLDKRKLLLGDEEKAVLIQKLTAAGQVFSKVGNKCSVVTANVLLDGTRRTQATGVLPIFIAMPTSGELTVNFTSLDNASADTPKKKIPARAINPKSFGHLAGFTLHSRLASGQHRP